MQSVNEIWPVYDTLQKAYYKKKKTMMRLGN